MTSEMIIRVAKALSEVHKDGGSDLLHYKYSSDEEGYQELAIAAIEAMRDPTEYMVASGSSMHWDDYRYRDESTKDQWQAMINAALKGNNNE